MHEKLGFYLVVILLAGIGAWGVWLIKFSGQPSVVDVSDVSSSVTPEVSGTETINIINVPTETAISESTLALEKISQLIEDGQAEAIANDIDSYYSELSSDDLNQIKRRLIRKANALVQGQQSRHAQTLLISASSALDDLDIWNSLANISIELGDWPTALNAQLKSSSLEIDPEKLDTTLVALIGSASQLRARFEQADDELSIAKLYQQLNSAHPGYPRFQLELAQSYLRLDNPELALPLLEQLQYDPEFGNIAKQKIDEVAREQQSNEQTEPIAANSPRNRTSDILVPLNRVGNSFLVSTSINGRSSPLLLDTGASITSLSSDLIRRLNLEPTGRSIRLSTANGITSSMLYKARRVRLGRLLINDLIVAEIDLTRGSRFQGLLGTDVLNRVNANYSYLIDNQQNALIFRRR